MSDKIYNVLFICTGNSARSYPDPSNAEGGEVGMRRAFEATRQAIGYRMLQLLSLPFESLDRAGLHAALAGIGRS